MRFEHSNCETFLPYLFRAIANKLKDSIAGEFVIVPIPNSTATIKDENDFRTLIHAREIAAAVGSRAKAIPALRWAEEKLPAHRGGSRDPQIHLEKLRIVKKPELPIVLFDDVVTTGSQMIGSYRCLAAEKLVPVSGFSVGRATKEQKDSMLGWATEKIIVEDVPIDWSAIFGKRR
jgi:predicted amidophosphoribosyltransferase